MIHSCFVLIQCNGLIFGIRPRVLKILRVKYTLLKHYYTRVDYALLLYVHFLRKPSLTNSKCTMAAIT